MIYHITKLLSPRLHIHHQFAHITIHDTHTVMHTTRTHTHHSHTSHTQHPGNVGCTIRHAGGSANPNELDGAAPYDVALPSGR